jgi:RHS repeat-associated protein
MTASYTSTTGVTVSSSAVGHLVPHAMTYGLLVAPKNGVVVATQSPALNRVDFIVTATGSEAFGVDGTISCSGFVVSCRDNGNAQSIALSATPAGQIVTVSYSVDSSRGPVGKITLAMRGQVPFAQYGDTAAYTVTRGNKFVAVAVTPKSLRQTVAPGVQINQYFDVTNVGMDTSRFAYSAECSGALTNCVGAGHTRNLSPTESEHVLVSYSTSLARGALGAVTLRAVSDWVPTVSDSGVVTDSIDAVQPVTVRAQSFNPGANVAREQCVTIAAGADAAYECGDLRIVHALPAVTTMNRTRAPTLVYNSAQAAAHSIIAADVSVNSGTYPAALHATVTFLASGKTVVRDIPWTNGQSDGQPRRVAVQFDARALSLTTASQPLAAVSYKLEVRALGDSTSIASDTGVVAVVDRSSSIFGKGWWVDGLECLSFITPSPNQILWVGGDGSSRLYTKAASNTWLVTPALDGVDSLTLDGGVYSRHLPNGVRVQFDQSGRHTATVNAHGDRTRFAWSSARDKLDSIEVPVPAGGARRVYRMEYYAPTSALPWRLHVVHAPFRQTVLSYISAPDGSTVVGSITDPDTTVVTFTFDAAGRLDGRIDRRHHGTKFEYDEANTLHRSTVDMTSSEAENIVRTFCAAESASLTACAAGAVLSDNVVTWYDGPRSVVGDTTWFHLTSFGAPRIIVNALHETTTLDREDPRWPLLVTRVIDPRGHQTVAHYDSLRGLITSSTDLNANSSAANRPSVSATTEFRWDQKWDRVTRILAPDSVVTAYDYDGATGDRLAQHLGPRTVSFGYDNRTHLLGSVTTAVSSTPTRYLYDALGNLQQITTPLGLQSLVLRDVFGRDSIVGTPINGPPTTSWLVRRYTYDQADRVIMTVDSARTSDSDSTPQILGVVNRYDNEGNLTLVTRGVNPDPLGLWTIVIASDYDAAQRKTREFDPNRFGIQTTYRWSYDAAGNATTTERGADVVIADFDALNRVYHRVVDGAGNPLAQKRTSDDQRFAYDASGNLISATNGYAKIGRSFTLGGSIATDTLRIATADLSTPDFSQHVYVSSYDYDRVGRRILMTPPSLSVLSPVSYTYDSLTGDIHTVRVEGGGVFRYSYTAAGLLDSLIQADGTIEHHVYDDDGRETGRTEFSPVLHKALHDETVGLDARGKRGFISLMSLDRSSQELYSYDGMGAAIATNGRTIESTIRDPLGNPVFHTGMGDTFGETYKYEPHSTRLHYIAHRLSDDQTVDSISQSFSINGDLARTIEQVTGPDAECVGSERGAITCASLGRRLVASMQLTNGYDADGHLVLAIKETTNDDSGLWPRLRDPNAVSVYPAFERGVLEEYRYDALGRRVWVRAHRNQYCRGARDRDSTTVCISTIQRTLYDGDQVLAEIRQPGDDGAPPEILEADGSAAVQPLQHFGQVGYVHGMGIDHPLELARNYASSVTRLVLHYQWQGALEIGTLLDGRLIQCGFPSPGADCEDIEWPGARMTFGLMIPHSALGPTSWWGTMAAKSENATGMLDMRNRQYDPRTGRFTQEDPIGLAGGMNLYGFGGGDAVNYSDPFGLCPDPRGGDFCPGGQGLKSAGLFDPIVWLTGGIAAGIERGLAATGADAAASAGARVAANKVAGDAFRDDIASAFKKNGYGVDKEVGKKTPFGRRVIDVEVSKNGEVLGGIEAKVGKSRYLPWQMAKDEYLRRSGYPVQVVRDATAVKISGISPQ